MYWASPSPAISGRQSYHGGDSRARALRAEERKKIETILCERAFNGVTHGQILDILQRYGSLEAAHTRAARYAESARKSICTFPDSEFKGRCFGRRNLWWHERSRKAALAL